MKIRDEILKYSDDTDLPILLALFEHYHWASQWSFVASASFVKDDTRKWGQRRVWSPTREGRVLYERLILADAVNGAAADENEIT
jgi:hypothetical protein